MIELSRRKLLCGLGALIAAPVVVRAASLMPVRGIVMDVTTLPDLGGFMVQDEAFINVVAVVNDIMRATSNDPRLFLTDEALRSLDTCPT